MALSLFGGDPEDDCATIAKAERGLRIDRMEPAKSLLLLKTTAAVAHGGGRLIQPDSPQYKTLLAWIEQGAPYSDEKGPKLVAVKAVPAEQVLPKGQVRPLAVAAVFSDGTQTDVTPLASFQSTDAKVAAVDATGKVKAEDFGQCAIVATYLRQSAVVRTVVPQPLSAAFPAVQVNNKIDELVFANLKTLGFPPAEVCSDEVFLRRVYLDVIGTLPTPEEALRVPGGGRSAEADQADRPLAGARGIRRLLGAEVGRSAEDQGGRTDQSLAQGGGDLPPLGPRALPRTSPTISSPVNC